MSRFLPLASDVASYMRVYISSGKHVTCVNKRATAINQSLDSPDIVFGEGADSDLRTKLSGTARLFPNAPLAAGWAFVHLVILIELLGRLVALIPAIGMGRDRVLMQRIADQHGADIHEINTFDPATLVSEHPLLWGITNWALLVMIPAGVWAVFPSLLGVSLSILLLLFTGIALLVAMLELVNEDREDGMVTEILENTNGVDAACVVLGKNHHPGVGERLAAHEGVDVINPERTNTG